ncbi:DUF3231 family protein [Paenibacillus thailandensis]|uniref:DUF3231 family protein n=1 Tax=Paenibacillus thailandensis TaxID=393250 RepID=A0ABW5QUD6_9BACL
MGILSGNPKEQPLHFGEISGLWAASMAAKGAVSCYQAYMSHSGDKDLKKILEDLIDQARLEIKECDALLTENGVLPAPALPERPPVKWEDIPPGARFSDPEIAAKIAADNSICLAAFSQNIGQAIREDVAALFAKYHLTKTALSARILQMNKDKGWLVPPPLHVKHDEPVKA